MVILIADSFLKYQGINQKNYFLPQLSVLDSAKVHDFELIWSEDRPIFEAAKSIKERILQAPTPITILAHGKGGLDAIECLIQFPELQSKVEKLVTIQSPVWGTPLADFLTGHPIMGSLIKGFCYLSGCRQVAIQEMSELNRQVYMILNKEKIRNFLKNVSVISVSSTFEIPIIVENFLDRIMRRVQQLVSKYAGANDGWVPLRSTRISNEPHIQLENVKHTSLVAPNLADQAEAVNLTRKILSSVKPSGLAEYTAKFPWGQSEANNDSKPDHPYQLEIS